MKKPTSHNHVYIQCKEHAWVPARMLSVNGNKAKVAVPKFKNEQSMLSDGGKSTKNQEEKEVDLGSYPNKVLPMQNVDGNGNLNVQEDMVTLPFLHEAAILYNLKARHIHGNPYTRTGDIVLAVNPYKWFKELYTEKNRSKYSRKLVWENIEGDPRSKLEPHVYEASALAYRGLAFTGQDQSILVSGESGAGKTETVKICMNHIASVQRGPVSKSEGKEAYSSPIVEKVVDSNPLLEAFGNAKTRRNDNSSRFGKYLQLQFHNEATIMLGKTDKSIAKSVLAGSKCEVYLLEKNRVVGHNDDERTFHIFYQLLAAPDSKKTKFWDGLRGANNESFKYVGRTDTDTIEGEKDGDKFQSTVDSLALVGIKGDKLNTLMRALCVVLQLGNITFGPLKGDNDKSSVTSASEFQELASVMGVCKNDLTKALTERTVKIRNEQCVVPQNAATAKDSCDAFAKEVYGKTFLWIVNQINDATCATKHYKNGAIDEFGIIGLLDIFGFESFETNHFEQLCINYANEKLQQKFTQDVFRCVQAEYEYEGIDLDDIKYDDNKDVLDLIERKTGLLAMLNEECVRPKGSDAGFVNKALAENRNSPCLITNKLDQMSFGIQHYAGAVMYDSEGFVSSNNDTLPTDLKELAQKSSNEIISKEVGEKQSLQQASSSRGQPKRGTSNIMAPTIWTKYKGQLSSLMKSLNQTQTRYIRCIKPNSEKKPALMEHVLSVEQLRCAGVVAAVTLSRSAFPNRLENTIVRFRYASLWDKKKYKPKKQDHPNEQARADCDTMLTCALKCLEVKDKKGNVTKAFVVGKTRTYFRAGALEYLEANRVKGLDGPAVVVQRYVRGYLVRKKANRNSGRCKNAAITIQQWWRSVLYMVAAKKKAAKLAKKKKAEEEKQRKEAMMKALAKLKEEKKKFKEEQEKAHKKKADKLLEKIKALKAEVKQVKKETKKAVSEANEQVTQIMSDRSKIRDKLSHEENLLEPKNVTAQRLQKLESNKEMINFLRRENKKLRNRHELMRKDHKELSTEVRVLMKANKTTAADFEEKHKDAKDIYGRNGEMLTDMNRYKKRNKQLRDDLDQRQVDYSRVAEARLEHQKTMAAIVQLTQDKLKDRQLAEDIIVLALECEAFAKSEKAGAEAVEKQYPGVNGSSGYSD